MNWMKIGNAAMLGGLMQKMGPVVTLGGVAAGMATSQAYLGPMRFATLPAKWMNSSVNAVENYAGIPQNSSRSVRAAVQAPMAYGKRGLDSNRLSTQGLTQSLYRGRRKI